MGVAEQYIAFDLGAESGRLMLGSLEDERLTLQEIHRFANRPVRVRDGLHWDVLCLWQEIKHGLARVAAEHTRTPAGIGLDTWGVDYALLDRQGALLGLPYHYRDSRTEGVIESLSGQVSEWALYARTGMSFSPVNTLIQLLAMRRQKSPALDVAHRLLLMPNLFLYWLCGEAVAEATIAGTTQFHDLTTYDWCFDLLEQLGLPTAPLPPLVPTATPLGTLWSEVAQEVGLRAVPVIATACHDTPAAASVVPSCEPQVTFISSGTWSVVGTELEQPLICPEGLAAQLVNEVAACGKIIFVRNCMGLWPVQACRETWARQGYAWSYADLAAMAARASAFAALVDPDDASFFQPGDMPGKLAAFCHRTGQPVPADKGTLVRVLLEGLALRYRRTLEDLDRLTGRPTRMLHILGGGSQNTLLCQFTADATGRLVLAGPTEATATATVLLQALARGRLASLAEVREVVARSCELVAYEPHPSDAWDEAYTRFTQLAQA